jgi:branched-chain amino acid transport system ATP-binding protein
LDEAKTSSSSTALLKLDGVSAGYGDALVLKGVSLEVGPGEIVGLLGPNGAGKTTLLNTVSRLTRLSGGSIRYAGSDIARLAPHELATVGISHCPEGRAIFQRLTVEENLIAAHLPGRSRPLHEHIEEIFTEFPILAEKRADLASKLSGGQQQMLAIGRALMCEPDLVMLDEPSLGLAPMLINQIFRIILRLSESGKTILLVEQNAKLALDLCDYAYVLENGRVKLEGPGADLLSDEEVKRVFLGQGAAAAPA